MVLRSAGLCRYDHQPSSPCHFDLTLMSFEPAGGWTSPSIWGAGEDCDVRGGQTCSLFGASSMVSEHSNPSPGGNRSGGSDDSPDGSLAFSSFARFVGSGFSSVGVDTSLALASATGGWLRWAYATVIRSTAGESIRTLRAFAGNDPAAAPWDWRCGSLSWLAPPGSTSRRAPASAAERALVLSYTTYGLPTPSGSGRTRGEAAGGCPAASPPLRSCGPSPRSAPPGSTFRKLERRCRMSACSSSGWLSFT